MQFWQPSQKYLFKVHYLFDQRQKKFRKLLHFLEKIRSEIFPQPCRMQFWKVYRTLYIQSPNMFLKFWWFIKKVSLDWLKRDLQILIVVVYWTNCKKRGQFTKVPMVCSKISVVSFCSPFLPTVDGGHFNTAAPLSSFYQTGGDRLRSERVLWVWAMRKILASSLFHEFFLTSFQNFLKRFPNVTKETNGSFSRLR